MVRLIGFGYDVLLGLLTTSSQFFNAVLIPQKLVEAGYTKVQAIRVFGRAFGMTMPLIYFPHIITSALVINVIPSLSENLELKEFKRVKYDICLSLKITFVVSIIFSVIYILYSKQLGIFLFNDIYVGSFIKIMGLGTVFVTLQHMLSGILYGMGKQISVAFHRLIGIAIQIICVYYLVGNPFYGINGFFIGFIFSMIVICILDFYVLWSRRLYGKKY